MSGISTISTISNERMEAFLDTIANQVREALSERADDMLESWHENIEEAMDNDDEKFPPLKIGIAATVDLDGAKIETKLRFSTVYQTKLSASLPDPNQPELPIRSLTDAMEKGDSMTLSVDGNGVTITK